MDDEKIIEEVLKENLEKPKGVGEQLLKALQKQRQDFIKEIEELDLVLFLESVVDTETGKSVEIPKEIWDLWTVYWEHIREKILTSINSDNQGCGKEIFIDSDGRRCHVNCGTYNPISEEIILCSICKYPQSQQPRQKAKKDKGVGSSADTPVVILDDNEISLMKYAKDYPENWKKICKAIIEEILCQEKPGSSSRDIKLGIGATSPIPDSQRIKGEGVSLHNSLEPRSKAGEDTEATMPVDVDNHADPPWGSEKCIMSKDGKCTSNYSPIRCNGIDIPDDCTYSLLQKTAPASGDKNV